MPFTRGRGAGGRERQEKTLLCQLVPLVEKSPFVPNIPRVEALPLVRGFSPLPPAPLPPAPLLPCSLPRTPGNVCIITMPQGGILKCDILNKIKFSNKY